MRVFVAGATGVLGRGVVPLLVAAGHDVAAVGRTSEKRARLERLGARAMELDLFDPAAVRKAVRGMDVVVNLATAVPKGAAVFLPWSWRTMSRIRREVSANLVAGALASGTVGRVIQESFAPIYEDGGNMWLDEFAPVRPARYNRSILDAEAQARRFSGSGRTGIALRFGLFYGPGDAVTAQLIDGVRRGWFPLFGRAEGYMSWLAHSDAARAVVAGLGVPEGIYNVVEDQPLTRRELADGIARTLGARPPRLLPPWATRLGGGVAETIARSLRISNRKFKGLSGWSPVHRNLVEGIAIRR